MPAGTIYPVFVHVSSPSPGAYAVRCTPASLTVNKGDSDARIVFLLVDETIPDDGGSPVRVVFPDRSGGGPNDDEYDGITIHGDGGRVFTGAFQVPVVAWRLHIHLNEAEIFPFGPGTALSMGATPLSVDPRYPEFTKTRHWIAGSTCERR